MRTAVLTWSALLWRLLALAALATITFVLGLSFGSSGLDPGALWEIASGEDATLARTIIVQARLPRVAMAALVGASLACSGACFQALLRNPLADPYVVGISGGAALGGTLFMTIAGPAVAASVWGVPAAAFFGASTALALIFGVERWLPLGRGGAAMLLLTGVIFNAFASSVIMFLKAIVSAQKAQELLFYLMGSLAVEGLSLSWIGAMAVMTVLGVLGIWSFGADLNAMSLGREEAAALGVDPRRLRSICLVLASLLVALSVAFCGLIGFVGLVVPHGLRLLFGPDNRLLLPASALGGAAFLTLCDLVARMSFHAFSTSLPVGVVTAFVGAPTFLYLLARSRPGQEAMQ